MLPRLDSAGESRPKGPRSVKHPTIRSGFLGLAQQMRISKGVPRGHLLAQCRSLASRQHGLITLLQALEIGLSRSAVNRVVASGHWERVRRGVFRLGGTQSSWIQTLMAATLTARGVASGRAAGFLWGLDGISQPRLEITIPREQNTTLAGVLIHRTSLDPRYVSTCRRVPTTDPSLTLLDLSAVLPINVLELALEDVLRRDLSSFSHLLRLVNDSGKGKPGCPKLRGLLNERNRGMKPTDSGLETRIWAFLKKYKLPLPLRQFEVLEQGKVVARPDFAYPQEMVAVEGVSYRFHSGHGAWERDRERSRILRRLGWIVIEVTSDDLRTRPEEVAREIGEALKSRGRLVV